MEESHILNNWGIRTVPEYIGALKVGNGESKAWKYGNPRPRRYSNLTSTGRPKVRNLGGGE